MSAQEENPEAPFKPPLGASSEQVEQQQGPYPLLKAQSVGQAENRARRAFKLKRKLARKLAVANPISSVGMKLFLIIFCSIVACVMTVGLMAYDKAKEIVENKVSDASLETVGQVANNLDTIFRSYEDLSMQLLVDKDFHEEVRKLMASDSAAARSESKGKLLDRLRTYVTGNISISGVLLIPADPRLTALQVGASQAERAAVLSQTSWFKQVIEKGGKTLWLPPQQGGLTAVPAPPSIGMTRLIKDSMTNKPTYVLVMELRLESFTKRFEQVKLGQGSEIAIVSSSGDYITSADEARIGKPADVKLPGTEDTLQNGSLKLTDASGTGVLAVYTAFRTMDWKLLGTVPVHDLVKDAKEIQTLTWITAVFATLAALAIGSLVMKTIAKPLVRLRDLMNEGAEGNLTVRSSDTARKDEIGSLSDSFNTMMVQIKSLAEQTTQSAADVLHTATDLTEASRKTAMSAKKIADATEDIAGGAAILASSAEKGSEMSGSIDSQMKHVIRANEDMARSAGEVEQASCQGSHYMGALIQKTGMTEEMTRSMLEKIDALKRSTGSVFQILEVLHNLSKQTNILSLNAAIEAARAGEKGRGFMVVADEIRKLADQSRQSIEVVGRMTRNINAEIDETVVILTEAYPVFQEQIGSIKEANHIFLTVQAQMGQFTDKLDLVTDAIRLLDQSQIEVAEAMSNVCAVAEESAATSDNVASLSADQLAVSDNMVALSEKLETVSRQLQASLTQFRL